MRFSILSSYTLELSTVSKFYSGSCKQIYKAFSIHRKHKSLIIILIHSLLRLFVHITDAETSLLSPQHIQKLKKQILSIIRLPAVSCRDIKSKIYQNNKSKDIISNFKKIATIFIFKFLITTIKLGLTRLGASIEQC